MNLFGFGGSGDYLSVDFGASAIKIAKASVSGNDGMQISLADSESLPDVPPDQYIEESGRVLSELVQRNDVPEKQNVILALPANDVIVRRLELPSMPEERMSKVIGYEAESHIPFPLDQVVLDHHVISQSEDGTEVILAAIKEENLNEHLDVIYEADLSPEVVDVTAFSYFNLFQFLETDEQEEDKPRVLVDVGHGNTDIMVFEGDTLYFARSASVAGEALTEDIAKKLGVELQEAQELKHEYGHIPLDSESEKAGETEEEEDMDALSQLAAEREESEAEEPAGEPTEPESAEAESEEDLEVGGLELGSPQSPSEEAEEGTEEAEVEPGPPETEAEAPEEQEEDSGGVSLGQPQEPEAEEETEGEDSPEPPDESAATAGTEAGSSEPEETEEDGEGGDLSLGQAKEPGAEEETSPTSPEEPASESPEESSEVEEAAEGEDEDLSLGQPKEPDSGEEESKKEKSSEPSAEADEEETTGEMASPEPPESEETEEGEDLSLGQAKQPGTEEQKEETNVDDTAEDEAEEASPPPPDVGESAPGDEEAGEPGEAEEDISLGSTREPEEDETTEASGDETESDELSGGMLDAPEEEGEDDSEEENKLMGAEDGESEDDEEEDGEGLSLGAAANDSEETAPEDAEKAAEVGGAIKPQIERLIGELRHTFDYFQSQLDGGEIEEIIISGGSSKLKNLPEFISDQLGYPARRLDLSDKISGADVEKLPELVVACGLQLRAVPDLARVDVNLVPGDIVEQKRAQTRNQKLTGLGVLAGAVVLMLLFTAYSLYSQRRAMFNKSKEKIEELKPIVDEVDKLKKIKSTVKKRLNVIQNLEDQKAEILPFLYDLNSFPRPQYSEALRDRTWLKSFNYSKGSPKGTFKIDGVTGDFEDASKVFKWMESREFILSQESENMNKQPFQVGETSQKMVSFSAQYSISFSEDSSGGD